MINAWPINSAAINSSAQPVDPPEIIDTVESAAWQHSATLDGADITSLLTGSIIIDREEGAAAVAELTMHYPAGTPVPVALERKHLEIRLDGQLMFAGTTSQQAWDATTRTMTIAATDDLQKDIEAMTREQISSLLPDAAWSDDAAEYNAGDHWQYLQDLLATCKGSLDKDVTGNVRYTPWKAKQPKAVYTDGALIYSSPVIDLAQPGDVINHVEVEIQYRYTQLWQSQTHFSWSAPITGGSSGMTGFCAWFTSDKQHQLPTVPMIEEAFESAKYRVENLNAGVLPPSMTNPCGQTGAWINNTTIDQALGFELDGIRRWTQPITETYTVNIYRDQPTTTIDSRHSFAAAEETEPHREWPEPHPEYEHELQPGQARNNQRRNDLINYALSVAEREIVESARRTRVTFSVPAHAVGELSLRDTAAINSVFVKATGKLARLQYELDTSTGAAIASLTLAISQGATGEPRPQLSWQNSANTTLSLPPISLPSQIGGDTVEPHNPDLDGFSGNRTARKIEDAGYQRGYPYSFAITSPAVDPEQADEQTFAAQVAYTVTTPQDYLEL